MILSTELHPPISEAQMRTIGNNYIRDVLGSGYVISPSKGVNSAGHWKFLINYNSISTPVGYISVNAATRQIIALTEDELRDVFECTEYEMNKKQGEIARDSCGYILRYHAWLQSRLYASNQIAFFARTDRPTFVEGPRPVWRATAFLQMRDRGRVCDLGLLDVDATTGDMIPLSWRQRRVMRKHALDAAQRTS